MARASKFSAPPPPPLALTVTTPVVGCRVNSAAVPAGVAASHTYVRLPCPSHASSSHASRPPSGDPALEDAAATSATTVPAAAFSATRIVNAPVPDTRDAAK